MWLLNVHTLGLEEFYGSGRPAYAILSHRWEHEEITFQNIGQLHEPWQEEDTSTNDLRSITRASNKIRSCCEITLRRDLNYVWIDTCCIDRKSSAELSEAINSMYHWYAEASVCLAYLFDVESAEDLKESSWFSRAWTLQELLAPTEVVFYNSEWRELGRRGNALTAEDAALISQCTGIPEKALRAFKPQDYSIATRMSWASERHATRDEDIAYSLLGLFDVNMPLLYGEGSKAFQRLQEEIMKLSNDMTIFLWSGASCRNFGMLAAAPSCFKKRENALPTSEGFSLNNAGLLLKLFVQPVAPGFYAAYMREWRHVADIQDEDFMRQTNWEQTLHGNPDIKTLLLAKTSAYDQYTRASDSTGYKSRVLDIFRRPDRLEIATARLCELRISRDVLVAGPTSHGTGFHITSNVLASLFTKFPTETSPVYSFQKRISSDLIANIAFPPGQTMGIPGYIILEMPQRSFVTVFFGFDFYFRPICFAQVGFFKPGDPSSIGNKTDEEVMSMIRKLEQEHPGDRSTTEVISQGLIPCYCYRGRENRFQTCSFNALDLEMAFSPRDFGFEVYVESKSVRNNRKGYYIGIG